MRAVFIAIFVFVATTGLAAKLFIGKVGRRQPPTEPVAARLSEPLPEPESVATGTLTKLPIELIGTIVRVDGSIATIKLAQHERENVEETSPIEKLATVTRIERERVYFYNLAAGTEEYIRLRPYDPSLAVTTAAMNAPGEDKEFNISREKIDRQLQNLPQLLMSARAVPVTDSAGHVTGFRIESMDETSFFKDLGLQPGDILTEVNGTKLESVEGVVKLFNELRGSSMIQLKASRQSRDLQLSYLIR